MNFFRNSSFLLFNQPRVKWFDDVDAAFAPVNDLRQGMDDPQTRFREMIIEDSEGNEHIGIPIKFQNEPGGVNFSAPRTR